MLSPRSNWRIAQKRPEHDEPAHSRGRSFVGHNRAPHPVAADSRNLSWIAIRFHCATSFDDLIVVLKTAVL
jgi:hypothetical protein